MRTAEDNIANCKSCPISTVIDVLLLAVQMLLVAWTIFAVFACEISSTF